METNELKKLLKTECLAIDPRSKKREFQPATIISIDINLHSMRRTNEIFEYVRYEVELYKITICKSYRNENLEYHRSFWVSGDRIKLMLNQNYFKMDNLRKLFKSYKKGENWPNVNKSHENLFIIGGQAVLFRVDQLLKEFFDSKINDEWQLLQDDQQEQLIKEFSEFCTKQ